jgi:hypothetical protein
MNDIMRLKEENRGLKDELEKVKVELISVREINKRCIEEKGEVNKQNDEQQKTMDVVIKCLIRCRREKSNLKIQFDNLMKVKYRIQVDLERTFKERDELQNLL